MQRRFRGMITSVVIASSVAAAALLAWIVHRYELRREAAPSPCERVITDVFSEGAGNTADSLLLAQLLEHRTECMKDGAYVDQARRLMLNTGNPDDARALLKDAERIGTFSADEMTAQVAWVDLADAHIAWTRDMQPRADELRNRALTAANELRVKWPEWPTPYLILSEAEQSSWKNTPGGSGPNYYQIENEARSRVMNGAFVRGFSEIQTVAYVFVFALIGLLALASGVSGIVAIREMQSIPPTSIADALPGYVKLTGTLYLTSSAAPMVAPHTHAPSVWYEIARRSGMKGSTTMYERSSQPFVLRDATGDVVVEPKDMHVRTRHRVTKFGASGAGTSGSRVTEETLREGDSAYALGELFTNAASGGSRRLRVAENGRRLLVSNFDEAHLVFVERMWFWIGAAVFLAAMLILAWSYYQRYHVIVTPGSI